MDQVTVKRTTQPVQGSAQPRVQKYKPGKKKLVLSAVVVLILLGLVSCGVIARQQMLGNSSFSTEVKKNQYQAVFLSNGQVYFGKINSLDKRGIKLTDIYYLQVQTPQPLPNDKTTQNQQQNLSLAKLGKELHGPEDSMFIEKSQTLFWENLKDDSQVVKAIKQNQTQK